MKNKCTQCGKEHTSIYSYGKCYDCKQKEEMITFIVSAILIGAFFAVIVIARVTWANIVFDDWRCALSECRIIKD